MIVFKRSTGNLLASLIFAPCAAFAVFFVGNMFVQNKMVLGGVVIAIFLFLTYAAVTTGDVRIELENARLRYFEKGKLREDFKLQNCAARYDIAPQAGFPRTYEIKLYIRRLNKKIREKEKGKSKEKEKEKEIMLDCSPIGPKQFKQLFELMEQQMGKEETEA
jgi:hypothetical protein